LGFSSLIGSGSGMSSAQFISQKVENPGRFFVHLFLTPSSHYLLTFKVSISWRWNLNWKQAGKTRFSTPHLHEFKASVGLDSDFLCNLPLHLSLIRAKLIFLVITHPSHLS
jgi:hypothetical protein